MKPFDIKTKTIIGIALLFLFVLPMEAQLIHPGMLHNRAELEFIKAKIKAGEEPWKSAWEKLMTDNHAKPDWNPKPIADVIRGPYNNPNIGAGDLGNDAQAAYIHSLEYVFTGDERHLDKAIEIINGWSYTLKSITGSDQLLLAGITGYKFCNAAELINSYSNKWKKSDQEQFKKMMMDIFYPLIKNYRPQSNGNWDAAMIVTTMCIGIFTDNIKMYKDAVEYARNGKSNGAIPNYIYKSGQCQESGRDQQHTQLGLGYLGDVCEVAWKQGDDLYGAFDNRLATGFEYTAMYNLNFDVPYDSVPDIFGNHYYSIISEKGRGSLRPIYEKVYHHYHDRTGLEMKYTKMVLDKIRPEGYHWDHPSFGTLLYYNLPPFPKGYNKSGPRTFVHPGILHKLSDLDRMKYSVMAKVDPWYASYQLMTADSKSSYNYIVQGDPAITKISRENPCDRCGQFESDARAAYLNALMWYITGDARHAEKTIQILNTWSTLTNFYGGDGGDREVFYGGGTEPLSAGIYGSPLINAAEIIKSTYSGWAQADIDKFKAMLVHPGYSNTTVSGSDIANDNVTFYWRVFMFDPARHGNQELAPAKTLMAIGIFLDNEIIYDRALRYIKGLPHRPDDLPYEPGPRTPGSVKSQDEYSISYNYIKESTIPDYGYEGVLTNYVYENGQCQESSRDQTHAMLGLGFAAEIAEMAWNQGDNLYGWTNNRLLKGIEYTLRYNISLENSYPDQLVPWEPSAPNDFYQVLTRSARWKALKISPIARGNWTVRPVWEMALNHYLMRMNTPVESLKWLMRARDKAIEKTGYEQSGYKIDHPGWGGLTSRRPVNCQGDPCISFANGKPVPGIANFVICSCVQMVYLQTSLLYLWDITIHKMNTKIVTIA